MQDLCHAETFGDGSLIARLDHRLCDVEGSSTILGRMAFLAGNTGGGDETEGVDGGPGGNRLWHWCWNLFFSHLIGKFSTGSSTCLGSRHGSGAIKMVQKAQL